MAKLSVSCSAGYIQDVAVIPKAKQEELLESTPALKEFFQKIVGDVPASFDGERGPAFRIQT